MQKCNSVKLYVLGVGHNTPVMAEFAEDCGCSIAGFYHYNDSRSRETEHGYKILGSFGDLYKKKDLSDMNFLLSMGDNRIRAEVFDKIKSLGGHFPVLVHPTAYVSKFSRLDEGSIVTIGAIITADCHIGKNTVISDNCVIEHNTNIGNHCYIAFHAGIGAYIDIDDFVFVGTGATLISGKVKNVRQGALIGAGAVVTKSIEKDVVVTGNPARPLPQRNDAWNIGGGY